MLNIYEQVALIAASKSSINMNINIDAFTCLEVLADSFCYALHATFDFVIELLAIMLFGSTFHLHK